MIHVLIVLAITATPMIPPSLANELKRQGFTEEFETISYASINMHWSANEIYRLVLPPPNDEMYQHVQVVQCENGISSTKWSCSDKWQWRINRTSKIYIEANDSINDWIGKDPGKALDPYVELISEVSNIYPTDRYGATLSAISIRSDGAHAIFSRFGSGCSTSIKIRSSLHEERIRMQLDLLREISKCI